MCSFLVMIIFPLYNYPTYYNLYLQPPKIYLFSPSTLSVLAIPHFTNLPPPPLSFT